VISLGKTPFPARLDVTNPSQPRPIAQDQPLSPEDLEGVYRAHWRRLHAIARRMVGPVEADAVIQEVFVALLREETRARFLGGDLGAWLAEFTRRKALQQLQRFRRDGREAPGEAGEVESRSPEEDLAARDLVRRFLAGHVPEPQRRFFELRFLERRTQVEIAGLLAIPRSTLEGWEHRLSRALRAFVVEES
jgi:RNA polymerase sigma factor (sigma-70 family)